MADFNIAYEKTHKEEGGYACLKGDNGGETMWGIARNFHENNKYLRLFWVELDNYKNSLNQSGNLPTSEYPLLNKLCEGNSIMTKCAKEFYKAVFWDAIKGDNIFNQAVANVCFDWYVNSGTKALKLIQEYLKVSVDGVFGDKTIQALNCKNGVDLTNEICDVRIHFYKTRTQNTQYIQSWVDRALRFKI